MSEHHLLAACRYVELNPVRVGSAKEAWSYKWSRDAAQIEGRGDKLMRVGPVPYPGMTAGIGDRIWTPQELLCYK
jgi:hypothetical protein